MKSRVFHIAFRDGQVRAYCYITDTDWLIIDVNGRVIQSKRMSVEQMAYACKLWIKNMVPNNA